MQEIKVTRPDSLPSEFNDLEKFVDEWALETREERRAKRESSDMQQIISFYEIFSPMFQRIAAHLDEFPMDGLRESEQTLLNLSFMFVEAAMAVEFHGQPTVPGGFLGDRWVIAR